MNFFTTKHRIVLLAFFLGFNVVLAQEFQWGKLFQSNEDVSITGIDHNADGEFYVTGIYKLSMDIDPGPDVQLVTASGPGEPFYAKFDANGDLIWGFGPDVIGYAPYLLKLDSDNNMFIAGGLAGTQDVNPGSEIFNLTSVSSQDAYIAKFNSDGEFIHAGNIGGNGAIATIPGGLAVDTENNVIMTGITGFAIDLDPGSDEDFWSVGDEGAPFVVKLDNDLNYLWGFTINSDGSMAASRATTDSNNNVIIMYRLSGEADFDPGSGEAIHTSLGVYDIVVAKYSPDGDYLWSKQIGGSAFEIVRNIAVDSQDNIYCTGEFGTTVDFDPGPNQVIHVATGSEDGFIIKYNSEGIFQWVSTIVGVGYVRFYDLKIDQNQNIHLCGTFSEDADFDPSANSMILSTPEFDYSDISYAVYSATDGSLISVVGLGSLEFDSALKIDLDPSGGALIAGEVQGTADLDPGPDVLEFTMPEDISNAFLIKFSPVPVSVFELAKEEHALIIYPNPSNGVFNIRVEDEERIEYSIHSIDGRFLESGYFNLGNNNFELANQASGAYMLRTNSRAYILYKH